MKIPCIKGEWKVLFKTEVHGNYVNDHSVVKGSDGLWHIYVITSQLFGHFSIRIGKS